MILPIVKFLYEHNDCITVKLTNNFGHTQF